MLLLTSASEISIRRFVITEKTPTRATTAFTFKTLLRHYAKRALTPLSLNVKLGPRRAAIRHYANQPGEGAFSVIVQLHRLIVYSTSGDMCCAVLCAPDPPCAVHYTHVLTLSTCPHTWQLWRYLSRVTCHVR